jgi:hypothetical protein
MEKPSLGQVGFEKFWAHMVDVSPEWAAHRSAVRDWDSLSGETRACWAEAAAAVVMEYDARLFADAEQRALALGLDPAASILEPTRPADA